jgi:hypothetical protein
VLSQTTNNNPSRTTTPLASRRSADAHQLGDPGAADQRGALTAHPA